MTEQQTNEFNLLYNKACDKMEGIILLGDYRPKQLGFFEKLRARKAITYFKKALLLYPEHFQSLFFIGKLHQSLGEHDQSLLYFDSALQIESANHHIAQEASLAAMHLNRVDKAIMYSKESIKRKPNDPILLGNHAMNLLIAGFDDKAKEVIEEAISINPADGFNQRISNRIRGVIAGESKRPTFKDSIG